LLSLTSIVLKKQHLTYKFWNYQRVKGDFKFAWWENP
jgi:hypothetical protein